MKHLRVGIFFTSILIVISSCNTKKYKDLNDGLYADIETVKGDILVALDYKKVPITTANFVTLAEGTNIYVSEKFKGKPFYDGLTFHRVVPDFMIQGGDPNANGTGSPGYKFENEHPMKNDSTHLYTFDRAGVLAMANAGRDTNGSQFFITHIEYPSINGGYSIFGQVKKGQNVVDSIAIGDKINTINIIRIGQEAKEFNAPYVFNEYFKELEVKEKKRQEQIAKVKADFLKAVDENKTKAEELSSGLKMYITKEGTGIKPKTGTMVRINYAGYFTDGNLFDTSYKELAEKFDKYSDRKEKMGAYNPFTMVYSTEAGLVPGFREGMLNMNYGDKAMLFIPSHLGYGTEGSGPIPPNTDLIFEMEIVDESQDME